MSRPVTRMGLNAPDCEPELPPSVDAHHAVTLVTVPPLSNGGPLKVGVVKTICTDRLPAFAVAPVGASGTSAWTKLFDAEEGWLVPAPFVAVTEQAYVRPFVRPLTVIGLDGFDALPAAPPLLERHDVVKPETG